MSIECENCHSANFGDRRFCGNCGAALGWLCVDCQWRNDAADRFCGGCGTPRDGQETQQAAPLSRRQTSIRPISFRPISKTDRIVVESPEIAALANTSVQRRQVTALFADMTGYSKLANQLDAEEVHAITNRYRSMVDEIIESHDGIVPRHFGDAVLGLFGYPTAHTNDPERAIRTALKIHSSMDSLSEGLDFDLKVHIGIASGTALVDSSGRQLELTGRAIILGSRLYDLAEPGQTLIADTTYRAVERVAHCTELGERSLKGFDSPALVWRLNGLPGGKTAAESQPIVGRQQEIEQIKSTLTSCQRLRAGGTLYVRGEAGIGKSRLLTECGAIAAGMGFQCHAIQILDFGLVADRDPIRLLLAALLGLDDAASTSAQQVADAASVHSIDSGLIALLNHLLGVDQSEEMTAVVNALDHATRQLRINQILVELTTQCAHKSPLLIVIEDIHWAEPQLLDQIQVLSEAVVKLPVLLVLSSRPDGEPITAVRGFPEITTIELDSLGTADLRNLAVQLETHSTKVVELCVERSGGNPLFLEQLLRSKDQIIEETLPGSINSIVQSRVDRLKDRDRLMLQAASVIGQQFDMETVSFLIKSAVDDPASLIQNHLVRREVFGFRFAHALIREGVYGALLSDVREMLHSRAAAWYQDRDLALWARHLSLAGSELAIGAFQQAVSEKIGKFQYDGAMSLVKQAQPLLRSEADEISFRFLEGKVLQELGQIGEAINAYQWIVSSSKSDVDLCRARISLASNLRVQDRLDEALEHLQVAQTLAQANDLKTELGQIHHQRGNIFFPRRDIDACLEQHECARAIAIETGSAEAEANALSGLGDANYQRGRMQTAAEHYEQCINIATNKGLVRIVVANRHMQGLARYFQGRLSEALSDCLVGAEYAFDIGHQRAEMAARSSVGPIQLDFGDYHGAGVQAERGMLLAQQLGARRFEPLCLTTLARIEASQGEVSAAMNSLRRALDIARETGESFTAPWILGAMASISNDEVTSQQCLEEGQRILDKGSLAHCHLWFYRDALEVYLRRGDREAIADVERRVASFTAQQVVPWMQLFVDYSKYRTDNDGVDQEELASRIARYGFKNLSLDARTDRH